MLLVGGSARPAFGGGEIVAPIEIYLAGRATKAMQDRPAAVAVQTAERDAHPLGDRIADRVGVTVTLALDDLDVARFGGRVAVQDELHGLASARADHDARDPEQPAAIVADRDADPRQFVAQVRA